VLGQSTIEDIGLEGVRRDLGLDLGQFITLDGLGSDSRSAQGYPTLYPIYKAGQRIVLFGVRGRPSALRANMSSI